jgi:hypothetical protein
MDDEVQVRVVSPHGGNEIRTPVNVCLVADLKVEFVAEFPDRDIIGSCMAVVGAKLPLAGSVSVPVLIDRGIGILQPAELRLLECRP